MTQKLTPVLPFAPSGSGPTAGAAAAAPVAEPAAEDGQQLVLPGWPAACQQLALREGGAGAFDPRTDVVWAHQVDKLKAQQAPKPSRYTYWLSAFLVGIAVIDNALAYVAYFTVRAFHGRLYNIVDLHLTLLDGIDVALLIFAVVGTLHFLAMVALVECAGLPLFHELMNCRLVLSSVPVGVICAILVYYSERTLPAPFAALTAVLCSIFLWCLHMRVQYNHQLNVVSKISLDVSWFSALVLAAFLLSLYCADKLEIVTNSDDLGCPQAHNNRMPVHVLTVDRWYCAPWDADDPMEVSRVPVSETPVRLSCTDSFVTVFGGSIEPHAFDCPAGCLRTFDPSASQGGNVVGCGTYAVDSPVCVAAIHAGAITDEGGQAVVYGRLGVSRFERCSRGSVTSLSREVVQADEEGAGAGPRRLLPRVPAPVVRGPGGRQIPQAFHFNNHPETREFVWLKKYEEVSSSREGVDASKPWTRIEATVSMRIAGVELDDEKVLLGASPLAQSALAASGGGGLLGPECRVRETGVLCRGAGSAAIELDFCRPEARQCP